MIECGLSWEDGVVVSLGGVIGSLFICIPLNVVMGSGDTWRGMPPIGVGLRKEVSCNYNWLTKTR